jgi:beta-lactam-binding protein with PASTA domain
MRSSVLAAVLLVAVALLSVPAAGAQQAGRATVPVLYGLTKARAVAHVHAVGLKLSSNGSGKVVSQSPAPGTHVPAGSTVHVTLHAPGH